MLAWHCILLASLQVHLHGDGACLGLHVGLGFSAPRVAFNMTRQPDVNITGAVVATACHGVLAATSVGGSVPASWRNTCFVARRFSVLTVPSEAAATRPRHRSAAGLGVVPGCRRL